MLSRTRPFLLLLLLLLLHTVLVVLNHPGPPTSDDRVYFEEAKNLLNGDWELQESPKNHRFGVILPAALSIDIFGETGFGIYAWPLLCSLLTLILLFEFVRKQFNVWNACLATSLLALSLNQIIYSGTLFPDVISSLLLFAAGIGVLKSMQKWEWGIVAGILFLLALFVRETAFLFLPALIFPSLFVDGTGYSRKGLKVFVLITAVLSFSWQVIFWALSGDISFVYSTVDAFHNKVFAQYEKADLYSRLFVDPFSMILSSYSLLPMFLLALPVIVRPMFSKTKLAQKEVWGAVWVLCSILALWFGTTSFTSYAPLPLLERFWIVLLPLFSVLSIYSLNLIPSEKIKKITGGIIFLGFLLVAFYFTWCNAPFFSAE